MMAPYLHPIEVVSPSFPRGDGNRAYGYFVVDVSFESSKPAMGRCSLERQGIKSWIASASIQLDGT